MAETIKVYSTEEMRAQGLQMNALKAEYEALFAQVTNALNAINDAWSPTMANNFSAKISNAQKAFSSIAGMLERGASAAQMSATLLAGEGNPGRMLDFMQTNDEWYSIMQGHSDSGSQGNGGFDPRSIGTADLVDHFQVFMSKLSGGGGHKF